MKNMVTLIDTDVLLDFILRREQFYENALAIIQLHHQNKYRGFISSQCIPNMYYVLRKYFSETERRETLIGLCYLFPIYPANDIMIIQALREKSFKDFEDCLQSKCAEAINADYIVTRNIKDFKNSKVKAITPQDFLSILTN
jgi:predicted nucleic acid-binding protein